jgi:hypothetical protein
MYIYVYAYYVGILISIYYDYCEEYFHIHNIIYIYIYAMHLYYFIAKTV